MIVKAQKSEERSESICVLLSRQYNLIGLQVACFTPVVLVGDHDKHMRSSDIALLVLFLYQFVIEAGRLPLLRTDRCCFHNFCLLFLNQYGMVTSLGNNDPVTKWCAFGIDEKAASAA
jgi:hypothetical protein